MQPRKVTLPLWTSASSTVNERPDLYQWFLDLPETPVFFSLQNLLPKLHTCKGNWNQVTGAEPERPGPCPPSHAIPSQRMSMKTLRLLGVVWKSPNSVISDIPSSCNSCWFSQEPDNSLGSLLWRRAVRMGGEGERKSSRSIQTRSPSYNCLCLGNN